jgi:hypothetical protein
MNNPSISLVAMSGDEARSLTNQVKASASALWANLLRLYEGGAHTALGYASWAGYCADEFDMSDAQAYRLLQSARVVSELPIGSSLPRTESQVRELARVDAGQRAETWQAVVEEHGPEPTAREVKEVVERRYPKPEPLGEAVCGIVRLRWANGVRCPQLNNWPLARCQ